MKPDSPIPGLSVMLALAVAVMAVAGMTRCHGAERVLRIAWDASPEATSYEVFRGTDRIATTHETTVEIRIGFGSAVIAVRALNGNGASPLSAPLTIPPVWSQIRQTIEFSPDLKTWSDQFTPAARFARIRNETKP